MKERFDILCNNCGHQVVFRPFQEYTTCSSCGTHLKLEETERTIAAVIVEKQEFLKTQQQPIPVEQNDYYQRQQELLEYEKQLKQLEKDWETQQETFKVKNNKKMIFPQKTHSLIFIITSIFLTIVALSFGGIFFFLLFWSIQWLWTSSKEYYKALKYEQAKQDYEDEKERLQMAIDLLR